MTTEQIDLSFGQQIKLAYRQILRAFLGSAVWNWKTNSEQTTIFSCTNADHPRSALEGNCLQNVTFLADY